MRAGTRDSEKLEGAADRSILARFTGDLRMKFLQEIDGYYGCRVTEQNHPFCARLGESFLMFVEESVCAAGGAA